MQQRQHTNQEDWQDMETAARHLVLTPRERDLVRAIIAGRTNREMAIEFGLSEQSIKNVLSTVYQKWRLRATLSADREPLSERPRVWRAGGDGTRVRSLSAGP